MEPALFLQIFPQIGGDFGQPALGDGRSPAASPPPARPALGIGC